jgi:hypothetical protein
MPVMKFIIPLAVFLLFFSIGLNAQHVIETPAWKKLQSPSQFAQLQDGSFVTVTGYYERKAAAPFYTTNVLLHLSPKGDSLQSIKLGTDHVAVLFNGFRKRNDSVFAVVEVSPDSVYATYSHPTVVMTYYIKSFRDSIALLLVKKEMVESPFYLFSDQNHFKYLNWYYYREVGYDATICRINSDTSEGYKLNEEGAVTIKQLIETADGGVLACGDIWYSLNGDEDDFFVIKLDSMLRLVWKQTYGVTKGQSLSYKIKEGSERTQYSITYIKNGNDSAVALTSPKQIADTISYHSTDLFSNATVSPDGGLYLCGMTYSPTTTTSFYLVSTDPNGKIKWTLSCPDTVKDSLYYYTDAKVVFPAKDNGCIMYGNKNFPSDPHHSGIYLMYVDSAGNIKREIDYVKKGSWVMPVNAISLHAGVYILFANTYDKTLNPVYTYQVMQTDEKKLMKKKRFKK